MTCIILLSNPESISNNFRLMKQNIDNKKEKYTGAEILLNVLKLGH